MGPNANMEDSILDEQVPFTVTKTPDLESRKYKIVYSYVGIFLYLHIFALYGLHLAITSAMWQTLWLSIITYFCSGVGASIGAHRLWSHNSFKATPLLETFLMLCQTISYQNTAIHWVRDHRLHHQHTDTDADPHNINRGFFYAHIGWLLVKKHPLVVEKGRLLNVDDLRRNMILQFQERNKIWLLPTVAIILPTIIPIYFWHETLSNAWHLNILRYVIVLNLTLFLNSASHKWGFKPYDRTNSATQNTLISLLCSGEGFHNYHHVFPWDYRSAEIGNYFLSVGTWLIDVFAYFGLAYDLKTASEEMVKARADLTGDGSDLWGFKGDKSGVKH